MAMACEGETDSLCPSATDAASVVSEPFVESAQSLFQWPQRVAEALSEPAACSRLQSMLLSRVVVSSDYSGYGSEIEALSCVLRALETRNGWDFAQQPFIFSRVCDIGAVPQKVLMALSKGHFQSRMCLFEDIIDHCHTSAAEYLRAAVPPDNCTQQEASDAYSDILQWLLRNRAWALDCNLKQTCLVHRGKCHVCPTAAWIRNSKVLVKKRRKCAGGTLEEADGQPRSGHENLAEDGNRGEDGNVPATRPGLDRPWAASFGGVTCDGWSTMGSQQRFAHSSELAHAVWIAERKVRAEQCAEDVAFVECTARYPASVKLRPLESTHWIFHFKCSPLALGYPVSRSRVFAACINKSTLAWIGPSEYWEQDFWAKFGRDCASSGDSLFSASVSERLEEYVQLAAQQKNFITAEKFRTLSDEQCLASLLSPGQQQRLAKYLQHRHELESPSGHFVFDTDHHLEARRMAGVYWPCMLTHGTIVSAPRQGGMKLATALEHFGAQGLHLFSASSADNPISPLKPILQGLKIHQLKNLSGRGVNLPVLSAFMWYVLSNTVPVWQACPLRASLSWELPEQAESDEDFE